MNSAVPPQSNWLCHDRFITRWAAQAMRQYFFLTGGATSLIWSSPSAFCKSAKARSHFSIGFVMGTGKTLLKTSTTLMESKRVMTAFGASLVGSLITMKPTQNNEGRTSFEDLTNTINGGDQTASN